MQCAPEKYETESHWLGIDPGTVRLGLAIADCRLRLALPLGVLPAQPRSSLARRLREALGGRRVHAVVVGLPLQLSGAQGAAVELARSIGSQLAEELGVTVHYCDERFSSAQVEASTPRPAGRARRPRAAVDAAAAAVILQSYLDRQA